jgi:hypothetical protein
MREATLCVPYEIGMPEQSISYSTRQILGAVKSRVLRVNDLSYIFENKIETAIVADECTYRSLWKDYEREACRTSIV